MNTHIGFDSEHSANSSDSEAFCDSAVMAANNSIHLNRKDAENRERKGGTTQSGGCHHLA